MADKPTLAQKIKMFFKIGDVDNSIEVDATSKVKVGEAEVTLGDLMTAHTTLENAKAAEAAVKAISDETVITLENGKTATVKELKADYLTLKASSVKNAEEEKPKEKSAEEKEKESKAEQAKEDKIKAENALKLADEQAKKDAFEKLKNAAETRPDMGTVGAEMPMMQSDRLAAGNKI
jgi:hypothetical protein